MATIAIRVLFACVLGAATAQAQRRAPLLGVVRDAAGAAVASAMVTVIEDDPDLAGIDPVDVLEATTDTRGRFKVDALCGVRYVAVAVGPEQDGRALVARPVHGLACGRSAELTLAIEGRRRDASVAGLVDLAQAAQLQASLVVPLGGGHRVALALGDAGTIAVSPLAAAGDIELRDRDGAFVGDVFVPPGLDQTGSASPLLTIAVIVTDADGRPAAGARVSVQRLRAIEGDAWTPSRYVALTAPAATTDARGRATVRCITYRDPFEDAPNELVVAAVAADGREGVSGWASKEPFVDWKLGVAHRGAAVRVTLPAAAPVPAPGRAAGAGVVGRTARAFVLGLASQHKDGALTRYFVPRTRDVVIGADGAFPLPVAAENTGSVTIVTGPIDGRRVVWLPARNGALPELDLATCEPLSVRIVDASGGPAVAAEILLVPADCTETDLGHAPALAPDPAGRVDVILQRGRWTLLAEDATHWGALDLVEWAANTPVTLRLEPKPAMRVRVVDVQGNPVAGARFEPDWFHFPPVPRVGPDAALVALGWNGFATRVRAGTTDANGEATLRWLPVPGSQPKVFAFVGDHTRRSDDGAVVAGADPLVLKLRQ